MNSIDLIKSDNLLLNGIKDFYSISYDETHQFVQKKELYKSLYKGKENHSLYAEYKANITLLRAAKLPFRIVDIAKNALKTKKDCHENIKRYLPGGYRSKDYTKEERKMLLTDLEAHLLTEVKLQPENAELAERIYWIHGTNSAMLPLLPYTQYSMIPTGDLLNRGIAPMSGELDYGGMKTYGINQNYLSVETIRAFNRCFAYASKISHSFDSSKYENAEKIFIEQLKYLKNLSPNNHTWDNCLIKLIRLKQWNLSQFIKLCEKHANTIQQIKDRIIFSSSEHEMLVLKALDYDLDELKQAQTDNKVRNKIKNEFYPHLDGGFYNNWDGNDKVIQDDSLNCFIIGNKFSHGFESETMIIWHTIRLRLVGEKELSYLQKYCEKNSDDQLAQLIWKKIKERAGDPPDLKVLMDKLIREKIQARIKNNMKPFEMRFQRLLQVFNTKSEIQLNENDRNFIQKPFPMIIASTKMKSQYRSLQEYNIKNATFGKDVDLIFVNKENQSQFADWLKQNSLDQKIQVFGMEWIEKMQSLPLMHAPHQVIAENPYLSVQDQRALNKNLLIYVIPLYKKNYPDGTQRFYHDVVHAMRTTFFSKIIAARYIESGYKFSHGKAGDLQIAMGLHDCARENDGEDLWDKESGLKCHEVLITLGRTKEEASLFEKSIAEKDDKNPFCLEQKVIHDADCLDIIRCLRRPGDFKPEELWMLKDLDVEQTYAFIDEARAFITLTEKKEIKEFINQSQDPYRCLIQILYFANRFHLMTSFLSSAEQAFCEPSEYLLTQGIEKAIEN